MVRKKSQTPKRGPNTPKSKRQSTTSQKPGTSVKATRRHRPGTAALREIRHLQKTSNHLISKAAFIRVVREILLGFRSDVDRIQSEALMALQEAAEMYMVTLFEDAMICAIHARRVTCFHTDMRLVRRLRGQTDPGNY